MLAINIDDVINVLNSCKPYLIALGVVLLLAIIVTVACMKMKKSVRKLVRKESWMAFLLALVIIVNLICFGPMNSMISLAMGDGSISDETVEEAKDLCSAIAEEGIVLLKNEGALPYAQGTKLNVFGWSSTNPVYGGTGSGSLSDAYPTVSLLDGLKEAGFEVNQDIVDFYTNYQSERPMVGMWGQDWTVPEPTMDMYDEAGIFDSAKEYSDTAVIVIARSGGEGADLPLSITDENTFSAEGGMFGASGVCYSSNPDDVDPSKHYLELTNREQAMIERVTSEFNNVVVIINSANAMELGWVEENPAISSVIYCPGTGQTGFLGLGEIMSGAINPSGKTADTFVYDLTATPTYNNFGNYVYDNMDDVAPMSNGEAVTPTFVNYTDNIYVGYRFYETAADEGFIDYDKTVQYPFGYGLSYTSFSEEMGELVENDGKISVDITVKNTGDVAGKDVVELYYNPPYTNGGIEKASANLIAFDKTNTLEPGASETITLTFDVEDMASYDAKGAAGTAESNAKTYTDEEIVKVKAYADQAEADANSYADGLNGAIDTRVKSLEDHKDDYKAYADQAELDAIASAKEYSDGLDTAMNTRVEALEAIGHTHANKAELDKIVDGDKAKWDAAVGRLETFLDSEQIEGTVDTLHEIQNWMNGDGVNATELTEAIAAEAKLRGDADSAMATRIKDLEDHKEDYKAYADQAEADANSYADGLNGAMDTRVKANEDAIAIITSTDYTKEGSIAKAKADAIAAAQAKIEALKLADTYETKTDAEAKLSEAKSYADGLNGAMDTRVKSLEDHKDDYKAYADGLNSAMDTRVKDLEDHKEDYKAYADQAEADAITTANAYSTTYTDTLFESIKFAANSDIDTLFD